MITIATVTTAGSTLTQVLPSVATVVSATIGALVTGFGAAALKHKWDSEADDTRWRRERSARIRAQRLEAFARYLSARPDLSAVRSLTDSSGDPAVVVSAIRLAAANLLILLPDAGQRDVVENDLRTVENWVASWSVSSSRSDRTGVPSAQPILDLARDLVIESDNDNKATA